MKPDPVQTSILHSIIKNGFPDKPVRLPFKPIYKSCRRHGVFLNEVLANLKMEGIVGQIDHDHIFFESEEGVKKRPRVVSYGWEPMDLIWQQILDNPQNLLKFAQQAMFNLSPNQMKGIGEKIGNLSEVEKQEIFKMVSSFMDPDKKP